MYNLESTDFRDLQTLETILDINLGKKPDMKQFEDWLKKYFKPTQDYQSESCQSSILFGNMDINEKLFLALQEEFFIL